MKLSQIFTFISSLILIAVFFLPIWSISLEAPQYPEGLGLYIYVNKIIGHKEKDLENINGLNHYIGMKHIEPESINELKVMPYFIAFMIIFGIVTTFYNKKWLKYTWVALFIIAAVIGVYDFYMWEYDYGHNLSSTAAIKIPGMAFQPPLIGGLQLLNFYVTSWPDLGTFVIGVSIILYIVSILLDKNNNSHEKK